MAEETTHRRGPVTLLSGDRPLPHNVEAEVAVLGCMLVDPATAIDTAVSALHFENSFYLPAHQDLFKTIVKLSTEKSKTAIDMITVSGALEAAGLLEKTGGRPYLIQLMNSVPSAANIEHYVEIVRENAILRRLIQLSAEITERSFDPQESVKELVDRIEGEVMQVAGMRTGAEIMPVGEAVIRAINYIDKLKDRNPDVTGLQTGYDDLDQMITGLRPGEMFVLAARPSIGKTALALNMACNIALGKNPVPVGFFSLEMSLDLLVLRLICSLARVNLADIRDGVLSAARWGEIMHAGQLLKTAPIFIDDSSNLDVLELRAKARRMKRENNIRLLIIDYLQLLKPGSANRNATRENEVSQMSGGIKSLAKELKIPIIVLAQLNRQAEQPGQKPRLSHLRESGAIEQDADVVALLHRERDLEENQGSSAREGMDSELIIAKHRNGPTGIVPLTFLPRYTRFESRARVADEDVPRV